MNPSRILVVEDEVVVSREIMERLEAMGYQPAGRATSGEQCLKMVELQRPDLVLMDIRIKGAMDGIAAAEEIRSRFRLPVIFLTAYSEDGTLERAKLAEPYAYIFKPVGDRELKSAIEIALYRHRAEEEICRLNRLYDVLSHVNQSVVRTHSREELLSEVCRIIVERGGIGLAWIGWLDPATSRISPVAHYGDRPEMLRVVDHDASDESERQGSPVRAILEGKPVVCNECGGTICSYPLDRKPAGFGYQTCGSFPLRFQGSICGVLSLCTVEPGFFGEREVKLFEEIAIDTSSALDKIEGDAQRERMERALRESNQRLGALFERARDAILIADLESGIILEANAEAENLLGRPRTDIVGLHFSQIHPPESGQEHWEGLLRHAGSSQLLHLESEVLRPDGSRVPVEVSGGLVDLGNGQQVVQGLFRDISERKRAEQEREKLEAQLREAQKLEAIGTLAGGIAHDFNNILAPIFGYTEIALGDMTALDPQRELLEQVLKAANRAKELVKQILAFSRHELAKPMIPMNLGSIVKEALKLLRASLPATIEIRQDIEKGIAVADGTQVHQVTVNLCTNAAHAMEAKGTLSVSLKKVSLCQDDLDAFAVLDLKPGPFLKLSVADSGHGMDDATIQRIFDPYFTTKGPGKGTGLGLSVVHGIVKRHGGKIVVTSEPGRGSVFDVYIPAAEENPEKSIATLEDLPGGSERILLVEDEQMIVQMLTKMLTRLGYDVTPQTNPLEAFDLFRSNPQAFDLVVSDYTMPGMTGIDLAREIFKNRPDMPIVLCTGYNERLMEETARKMGILEIAMKPLDRKQLAELIRRILDGRSPQRA